MLGKKEPVIRVAMMPRDTNAHGFIFGGVILSHIDLAGSMEARKHTQKKVVTVAMKEVKFIAPVFVGDLLTCYTEVLSTGKSSITIKVDVYADRMGEKFQKTVEVTEAIVVYVAVDEDHKPIPICD